MADAKYIWMMFFGFKVKKEKLLPFSEDGKISKSNLIENIIQYSSIADDDFSIMSQLMDIHHRGFYTEDCLVRLFQRNGEDPAVAKRIFRNLDLDGYGVCRVGVPSEPTIGMSTHSEAPAQGALIRMRRASMPVPVYALILPQLPLVLPQGHQRLLRHLLQQHLLQHLLPQRLLPRKPRARR